MRRGNHVAAQGTQEFPGIPGKWDKRSIGVGDVDKSDIVPECDLLVMARNPIPHIPVCLLFAV